MRRLRASAIVLIATTVLANAQASPLNSSPPTNVPPAKAPEAKRITGIVTPDRLNENFENFAKRREAASGPTTRGNTFFLMYANDANEFSALARYSVLLLAVLTQKPDELPVKRVYIRANNQDIPLPKLSSWSSKSSEKLLSTRIYGSNREDGFYLFPTAAIFREGQLHVELSEPIQLCGSCSCQSTTCRNGSLSSPNRTRRRVQNPTCALCRRSSRRKRPGFRCRAPYRKVGISTETASRSGHSSRYVALHEFALRVREPGSHRWFTPQSRRIMAAARACTAGSYEHEEGRYG